MSKTTTNYGLIKPEGTDAADITAMNPNWDKIDEELNKTVPVTQGGTGCTRHTVNSILIGNGSGQIRNVLTKSGALYASETSGTPQFGTLPIAQGGTGANSVNGARANLGLNKMPIFDAPVVTNDLKYFVDPEYYDPNYPRTGWYLIEVSEKHTDSGGDPYTYYNIVGSFLIYYIQTIEGYCNSVLLDGYKYNLTINDTKYLSISYDGVIHIWNKSTAQDITSKHRIKVTPLTYQ